MVLRRVTTPNRPMQNTTAASIRYGLESHALVVRPREVDRAEQRGEQQSTASSSNGSTNRVSTASPMARVRSPLTGGASAAAAPAG